MIAALARSRGVRKFRRSRSAMTSLAVILVYAFIAVWIMVMQAVDWAGRTTGAYSIDRVPVAGALLPARAIERVGPMLAPGLSGSRSVEQRADAADFYLTAAEQALAEHGRAVAAGDPARASAILSGVRFAERALAELDPARLAAALDGARERFDAFDALNDAEQSLRTAAAELDHLSRALARAAAGDAPAADEARTAAENAAFAIGDARASGAESPGLEALDDRPLLDLADALGRGETPAAGVGAWRDACSNEAERLRADRDAVLAGVEGATAALFPRPAGLAGATYALRMSLGTDRQGRSILVRAIYSVKIAVQIGVVTALFAVLAGGLLGAAAAFFGGWVDHLVTWLYSTFSAVPNLVLLVVVAFMFTATEYEKTLVPVYAAFGLTFWIGTCRLIRGEVLKIRELEYVQAATAIGFGRFYTLARHVIPNAAHILFIQFSLLFINAIKAEVVLTFLGLGVKDGASWGLMISQSSSEVIVGFFWQIGAATAFMLVLVLAFNVFTDALQDAFDPKHVS